MPLSAATTTARKYDATQNDSCATGNIGSFQLAQTLDDPKLEVAGVYVYNPDKDGSDAGELIGRDPVGVLVTNNLDDICAIEADVVLHAPLSSDMAQLDAEWLRGIIDGRESMRLDTLWFVEKGLKGYFHPSTTACGR